MMSESRGLEFTRRSGIGLLAIGACAVLVCRWALGQPASAAAATQQEQGDGMTLELQATIEAALADATRRTGLERRSLNVAVAQAVTWPDGSMGCPSPGRSYTQALVPGYLIRIEAGPATLEYHTNTRKRLVLCTGGAPKSSGT
jgi:hypothetical protein